MDDRLEYLRNRFGRHGLPGLLPILEVPMENLGANNALPLEVQPVARQEDVEESVSGNVQNIADVSGEQPPPPPPLPSSPPPLPPIEHQNREINEKLTYIEEIMNVSESCGLLRFNGLQEAVVTTTTSGLTKVGILLKKVMFWTISVLAIIGGLFIAKYSWMRFRAYPLLDTCLDFGNFATFLIVSVGFLVFNLFFEPATVALRNSLRRQEEPGITTSNTMCKWFVRSCLAVSVLTAAIAQLEVGKAINEWSIEKVLSSHTYYFVMTLLLWNSANTYEFSGYIRDNIAEKPSFARTIAVIANVSIRFCAFLVKFFLTDLLLCGACTMFLESRQSAQVCAIVENEADDEASAVRKIRSILRTKSVSDNYNRSFRYQVKVMVVAEVFVLTYLLEAPIDEDSFPFHQFALGVNAIKVIIFMLLSIMTSVYGRVCHRAADKIVKDFQQLNVDGRNIRIDFLVSDLTEEPIAVGRGAFLINEMFLVWFLTTVGTFFTIVAQAKGRVAPTGGYLI